VVLLVGFNNIFTVVFCVNDSFAESISRLSEPSAPVHLEWFK
jgi:hypothetical protein